MHSCRPPARPHPQAHPHHPCPPSPPSEGYLLQKITACEKRAIPCLCTEWCFDCCSESCVQGVNVCAAPGWRLEKDCTLRVSIPVSVRLCDPCGMCCSQQACVELETTLSRSFLRSMEDARNTLVILPCIRFVRAESRCGGCFRVHLTAELELCLVRHEICSSRRPEPRCPQLPLYPPPFC